MAEQEQGGFKKTGRTEQLGVIVPEESQPKQGEATPAPEQQPKKQSEDEGQ